MNIIKKHNKETKSGFVYNSLLLNVAHVAVALALLNIDVVGENTITTYSEPEEEIVKVSYQDYEEDIEDTEDTEELEARP